MEDRNGLLVDLAISFATGDAERADAATMVKRLKKNVPVKTLATDKGYDTKDFVKEMRAQKVTPHVATNT